MIITKNYQAASQGRIGIIDIGSNSIRFVVYDQLKRAPHALYNEKVMCQLGKGLALTGKLNPEGVVMAESAIARFVALARNMEVTELDVFATAAVRDAKDGEAFADKLEKTHRLHIDIISGSREAKLGAYGIFSSFHEPDGITGDLGGGSMEFVRIKSNAQAGERITLPIGPLRLIDQCNGDVNKIRTEVKRALKSVDWLANASPNHFYAIGGSFRAIARMHMRLTKYPLEVLHGYTVDGAGFSEFVKEVMETKPEKLANLPGVPSKRAYTLPAAATVLLQVIEAMAPRKLVFSASGIREGYLYEKLSPFVREEDGLIASCSEFASKGGSNIDYADELLTWILDVFPTPEESLQRLTYAFCLLNDIARFIHPEHRAEWGYMRVVQSDLTALTHEQRIQLALAVYHRHRFRLNQKLPALGLIGAKAQAWALVMGCLANLAHHLTGGVSGNLPHIELKLSKQKAILKLPKRMQPLMGESIKKRLGGVEEAYMLWRKA